MGVGSQGALVISLDFELHWGVRDHRKLDAAERKRLLAAREAVPAVLQAFRDHAIRATWGTVGLLFARSREEAQEFRPSILPNYNLPELDPYVEELGKDESDDPFHFAPSLIQAIADVPGQEIGCHSYSHYYSLEAGQTAETFKSDVDSAVQIARRSGYALRSYIFPRNQTRNSYLPILREAGFSTYRGTEKVASKAAVDFQKQRRPWARALRLMDAYCNLNGAQTVAFPDGEWPAAVNASRYLRPFSSTLQSLEGMRLKRISDAMKTAAAEKSIFHLWWHPEDFAGDLDRNLDFLHKVFQVFDVCRRDYGMDSLSMGDMSQVGHKAVAVGQEIGA